MGGLAPHETYRITASIPFSPVRQDSHAPNIPGVEDDMEIDNDIRQVVPVNTVTEVERIRIGMVAVNVALYELLVNLRANIERSGFPESGDTSATALADFTPR